MIPPFDEFGNLPFGIHRCTVEELVTRFGFGSPEREAKTEELLELIGCDVDVIILPDTGYPRDQHAIIDENAAWPFTQVLVAADDADLDRWALEDFGTDRMERQKGVVEVIL